jgi:predicted dienelactone hydrolase
MTRVLSMVFGGLILLILVAGEIVYVLTNPEMPPSGSSSARWLQPGPYNVEEVDMVFVDNTRPTMANNDYPGAPERTFNTTLWYPVGAQGPHPLVLHSHGFVSFRGDLSSLAELLASHGYVVASADYPLTSGGAPGGPNAFDVLNQPEDVSFLIDSVLALVGAFKPMEGEIDMQRIALTGYSIGGLNTTLATFHPRLRDERIKAAVSIAGTVAPLTDRFYQTTNTPFLAIAGTSDTLADYQANAVFLADRIPSGSLLTIEGGSHLGFISSADPYFRFMKNPDQLGCDAVLGGLGGSSVNDVFTLLGTEEEGVYADPAIPEICEFMPPKPAIHPGRQIMITNVAVLSFFESIFNPDEEMRRAAHQQLSEFTSLDFAEASFLP